MVDSIRLAANQVGFLGGILPYGHLQVVGVDGITGSQSEIEVQASLFWQYPGIRAHDNEDNTPNYGAEGKYDYMELPLGDRSAANVWELLQNVHDEFVAKGDNIPYTPTQNSNSFIKTILSVVGIDVNRYTDDVKPADVSSFPGERTNVLNRDATAISLDLTGTDGNDIIRTGVANDRLDGGDGDDQLYGGGGNDFLTGGEGFDRLHGSAGNDTVDYEFYAGSDGMTVNLSTGIVSFRPEHNSGGVERLQSIENVNGGGGRDTLIGSAGNNYINGGGGDDIIRGGGGIDTLDGGTGNDVYDYNYVAHSRSLEKSDGVGFEYAGAATGDKVDLSTIDANTGLVGNNAFSFTGTKAPAAGGGAGKLWTQDHYQSGFGDVTLVKASVDADKDPELVIRANDGAATAAEWVVGDFVV